MNEFRFKKVVFNWITRMRMSKCYLTRRLSKPRGVFWQRFRQSLLYQRKIDLASRERHLDSYRIVRLLDDNTKIIIKKGFRMKCLQYTYYTIQASSLKIIIMIHTSVQNPLYFVNRNKKICTLIFISCSSAHSPIDPSQSEKKVIYID